MINESEKVSLAFNGKPNSVDTIEFFEVWLIFQEYPIYLRMWWLIVLAALIRIDNASL